MDNSDQNKFKEILLAVTSTYDKPLNETVIKIWWNVFKPYSINDFEDAVSKHFRDPDEGMFMPKPANISKHLKADEIDVEAKAEIAWSEIVGKISSIGSYDSLKMDDGQALAAVKAMGGWKNLCSKTHEQLVWAKKEFASIYSNYESTSLEMLPESLPGRIELQKHKEKASGVLEQVKKLARERQ